MKKIMLAMSGGVDSSAAAILLHNAGYTVCGATLQLLGGEVSRLGVDDACHLTDQVADARCVAQRLGFAHYVIDASDSFRKKVVDRFVLDYQLGKTPNPCVECNRCIKFAEMLKLAEQLKLDGIATGHYAQIVYDASRGRYLLKKAKDETKDQTYVLYTMTQYELSRTLFPLGGLLKSEVRELAHSHGLVNANKKDSQDICFVPTGDYAAFIDRYTGHEAQKGYFIDTAGHVLGEHSGLIHYTIGQRKGLGISFGEPRFVVDKDAQKNTITLGRQEDLMTDVLEAERVNWISLESLTEPMQVTIKTRYKQREAAGIIYPLDNGHVRAEFREAQRAVTPGQAVVFYDGDTVVGGGTII